MNTELTSLSDLPTGVLIAIGLLALVQIAVEVWAIVKLLQTPDDRLVFGKKWPWLVIILFVNLIGAIVFLVAGRKPAPATDPLGQGAGAPAENRAARAADVLYGNDGDRR